MRHFILFLLLVSLAIPCSAQSSPQKPKGFVDSLPIPYPKYIFLIPEKSKDRLISVEFENPRCKALKWKNNVLKFRIPTNGDLCIANKMDIGMWDEEFYVVDTKGNRRVAHFQEQIFDSEIKLMDRKGRDAIVFRFFYGTKENHAAMRNNF